MEFLSTSFVIEMHKKLVVQFGGLYGIRDKNLLESALAYPQQLHYIGMEKDIHILAAAYCYHIINNHPFIDGNKRIGIFSMLSFLELNDIIITISQENLYDLAIKTAQSKISEHDIANLLRERH